jgi:hypothetical protein
VGLITKEKMQHKNDPIVQEALSRGMNLWGFHIASTLNRAVSGEAMELQFIGWDEENWIACFDQTSNAFLIKRQAQAMALAHKSDYIEFKTPGGTYRKAKVVQVENVPRIFISQEKDELTTKAVSSSSISFLNWDKAGFAAEFLPKGRHNELVTLKQEPATVTATDATTAAAQVVTSPAKELPGSHWSWVKYGLVAGAGAGLVVGGIWLCNNYICKQGNCALSVNTPIPSQQAGH